GRTVLGVGAGWSTTEFEGYSVWDPPKIRVEKTEEGLQLILKLWHEPKVDFNGKYYHAKGAVLEPKPVQKPHPPLLFGGTGTRMLRMAGKYGDICMISPFGERDPEEAKGSFWTRRSGIIERSRSRSQALHPSRSRTPSMTEKCMKMR